MPLDPRTPVVVGVGQVTSRPHPTEALAERPGPVDLLVRALRAAAEDASGARAGGAAAAGNQLLARAQSLRIIDSLGSGLTNPALAVAEVLGIDPGELVLSAIGGNMPQSILNQSADFIAQGRADVILVAGAEAIYTSQAARRRDITLDWPRQDPASTPPPVRFGENRPPLHDVESARGLGLPTQIYPLFENALRAARGWSLAEHRAHIGALWSGFSDVAATNPYAWLRESKSAEEIIEPSPDNRMVAFPYTKLCCANLYVDQSAAYIVCSVAEALAAGVEPDRWVFPLAGTDTNDHWFVSERPSLAESPAIRLAGGAALASAGVGIDDLAAVDLYSCFPSVVQIAAAELGLAVDDPDRPLTLTGGLTFFGGPGNNYTTHGIATLCAALRERPGAVGMTTGLGWFATKHAVGIYSSAPPARTAPFAWRNVQDQVDALARCPVDGEATGTVTVETYTVLYDRQGPERAVLACRTPGGARTWAEIKDPSDLVGLTQTEGIGRTGVLGDDRLLRLA